MQPTIHTIALASSPASEATIFSTTLKKISKKIQYNSKDDLDNSPNSERTKVKFNSSEKISSVKGHKNDSNTNFATTNHRSSHQQNKSLINLNKLTSKISLESHFKLINLFVIFRLSNKIFEFQLFKFRSRFRYLQ